MTPSGGTSALINSTGNGDAGYFDPPAREAATSQSLTLLAGYFAAAPTWSLQTQPQVAAGDKDLDELTAFLRMRVALAAGRQLDTLLRRLEGRASFHYSRVREESVGTVRGQLDMGRYLLARLRPESPRRYPIRVVHRRYATPENGLAAYGALWVSRELAQAPIHLIPSEAPEYREILDRRASMARQLRRPVLAEASDLARDVRRRRSLDSLVDSVEARIEGGHIAAPEIYRDIVQWIRSFDPDHSLPQPGAVEWSFYDERFDTKLFEIWCLRLLMDALVTRLGEPVAGIRPLHERSQRAIATWNLGAAKIRVYFQAALSRLGVGDVQWRMVEPSQSVLGGIPDIASVVDPLTGHRIVVLIDPKLRERLYAPTDEIYKLLGYFGNLNVDQRPQAAIVFYSPQSPRVYSFDDDRGGALLAIGVDPVDLPNATLAFDRLSQLILGAASISDAVVKRLREANELPSEDREDATAAVRQDAAVRAMEDAVKALPAGSLNPVRKTTSANLHEVWDLLSAEAATMVVTAEYFGQNAPVDADHSGPLLGLAAACERVLYDAVLSDVIQQKPELFEDGQTLGSLIRTLWDATRPSPRLAEGTMVAEHLGTLGIEPAGIRGLVDDLRKLNVKYRIPAAHREVVPQGLWITGRSFILDPVTGILSRLLVTFVRDRSKP